MPGFMPGIHVLFLLTVGNKTWMAGTSPAMTIEGSALVKTIVIALVAAASVAPARAQTLPGGFVLLRDINPTLLHDIASPASNTSTAPPLPRYDPPASV